MWGGKTCDRIASAKQLFRFSKQFFPQSEPWSYSYVKHRSKHNRPILKPIEIHVAGVRLLRGVPRRPVNFSTYSNIPAINSMLCLSSQPLRSSGSTLANDMPLHHYELKRMISFGLRHNGIGAWQLHIVFAQAIFWFIKISDNGIEQLLMNLIRISRQYPSLLNATALLLLKIICRVTVDTSEATRQLVPAVTQYGWARESISGDRFLESNRFSPLKSELT